DGGQYFRERGDVASRKDIFGDPGIGDAWSAAAADRVQQKNAVIAEKLRALAEESIVKTDPDMLEHADRHDAIEVADDIAIVLEPENRVLCSAALERSLLRACVLLPR